MIREYIVIKDILNIRSRPTEESDFKGDLKVNTTVWLDDKEIAGAVPLGGETSKWLIYNSTLFVSKDGLRVKGYEDRKAEFIKDKNFSHLHNNSGDENEWKVSWGHVDMEIWKIWKDFNTNGEGVRVAVIDTGASSENNDLKGRISPLSVSLIGTDISDGSKTHHGTRSAGLIGADGNNVNMITGIASKCELLIIKAGNNGFLPMNILKAIRIAIKLKCDIVSLSIESYAPSYSQDPNSLTEMIKIIQSCKSAGPVFFAAVGDNGDNSISYPASIDGCFSIGAYSLDKNNERVLNEVNNMNKFLSFLCPGDRLKTCSITNLPTFYDASSAATAFASGIFALILSKMKKEQRNFDFLNSLIASKEFTETLLEEVIPSIKQGYGLLTPFQLINFLNSQQ